jgi:hypothetical protein
MYTVYSQYGPGDAHMRQTARVLAEDLFEGDEEAENIESVLNSSGQGYGNDHFQEAGLGGGVQMSFGASQPSAATGGVERGSGVGRGSHLLRPAWMAPN